MSLTASMWTSVSGLLAHGEKMNVIGHNISNVNTVAYKSQRMDFQDFVYQSMGTANGPGQVGRGTNVGIIMNDFSQGSFENTTSSTDIGIVGNGFFAVRPQNNNATYYTRAGNFTFDREGYLVDPHNYVLQGWKIDRNLANQSTIGSTRGGSGIIGSGSPVDVKLDTFTCAPRHTTNIVIPVNLRDSLVAATDDNSTNETDPFFAMLNNWDATQSPPLGTSMYAHQTTINVYDEAGKLHKLTIYYDRVANGNANQDILGDNSGESYWEYIITMDPAEDVRDFTSEYDPTGLASTSPNVPARLKGLLGAGTITFDSTGSMRDMTAFVPNAEPGREPDGTPMDTWWDGPSGSEEIDLSKWVAAPISSNGFPMIAPNFSGTAGQQTAYAYSGGMINATQPNPNADGRMIAVNMGLRISQNSWNFWEDGTVKNVSNPNYDPSQPVSPTNSPTMDVNAGPEVDSSTGLVTADALENVRFRISGLRSFADRQETTTTNFGDSFFDHNGFTQDGYTYGDLRAVQVSSTGVLSATYSNGVTLQLFQITLHDFPSTQNLRREGGNLFSETRESGSSSTGAAGTGSFGSTQGYSLEQSNADLSREFVNMITTQRGFQANSKSITTVDTMLETVIAMKR